MLDVRRMQVLRSVVASGSITAAAQALGYTPSSVSQQITTLQREVGLQLVERVGRGIRLTAAARLLADHADQLFAQLNAAEQALEDHRHARATRLRVEYFDTAGQALIVPAITALTQQNPEMHIDLRLQPDPMPGPRISRGDVDLALTVAETPTTCDGVSWAHVLDDRFDAVLPVDHPLAARPVLDLLDLADLPWVSHEWPLGPCSRHVKDACTVQGFTPTYKVECDEIITAQGLIAAGLGIGVMPRMGLATLHPDVVAVPLRQPAPRRRIHMLTATDAPESVKIFSRLLINVASEAVNAEPSDSYRRLALATSSDRQHPPSLTEPHPAHSEIKVDPARHCRRVVTG